MVGNPEQQPAAVAELTVDQDKRGSGGGDGDMAAAAVVMAPKRKVRMHPDDVRFTMSLKREDLGGTEYLDRFAHRYTPEELDEHRRLHEEVAAMFRKDDEEMEARQAQVARELAEKGYVEVDEVDPADEEEYDKWAAALWKTMTDKPWFRRIKFADPRDVQEEGAAGWTVRPHDADEYEYEYEYEYDEDEVEGEGEYDDEEGQVQVTNEDEKENTNVKAHSEGETASSP